jgi:hypothetical protein
MARLVKCPDIAHEHDSNMRYIALAVKSRISCGVMVQAALIANLARPPVLLHPYHKQLWHPTHFKDNEDSWI